MIYFLALMMMIICCVRSDWRQDHRDATVVDHLRRCHYRHMVSIITESNCARRMMGCCVSRVGLCYLLNHDMTQLKIDSFHKACAK